MQGMKNKAKKSIKKNTTIDDLALMVAKGFSSVENRIEKVENRIGKVEEGLKELRENVKATRRDVLDIGDRFVPRYEFDNLLIRFGRLEQRVLGKRSK